MSNETGGLMMDKIVYIVTKGSYSDYHICAVCDSEEKANRYIEASGGGDIEEWTLNEYDAHLIKGLFTYIVWMKRDGQVTDAGKLAPPPVVDALIGIWEWKVSKTTEWRLRVGCWARNKQHAIKIANERRAQIIALNLWPNDPPDKNWRYIEDPLRLNETYE